MSFIIGAVHRIRYRLAHLPLSVILSITIILLLLIAVVSITLLSIQHDQYFFRVELEKEAELALGVLAEAAADAVYFLNVDRLNLLGNRIKDAEMIVMVRFYDDQGSVISDPDAPALAQSTDNDPFGVQLVNNRVITFDWRQDYLIAGKTIMTEDNVIGALALGLSTKALGDKLAAVTQQSIGIAVIIMVFSAITSWVISSLITRPLRQLSKTAGYISRGQLSRRAAVNGGQEFLLLAVSFNHMATQVETLVEELRASLAEKDILLKEIHHRVKNNLQIITSLLSLQSRIIGDPAVLAQLQDSQNRIRSMALVHERLYRSESLARVDFREYIHQLSHDLLRSYQAQNGPITLKVEVEDIYLDIETAIPCGLLVNELVSNALKHAFSDGREGEIRVELGCKGEKQYWLAVQDNGIGFPADLDFRQTTSLGLQLVNGLTRQLEGTIELSRDTGTRFEISFPGSR